MEKYYLEVNNNLMLFKKGEIDLQPFSEIALKIYNLIMNKTVTYNNLSNAGKLSNHLVNVAILGGNLGKLYEVNDLYSLILGCLLHDIGKMYISDDILNKKGKLNEVEKLIVSEHTVIGYKIISYYISDEKPRNIVLNHHSAFNSISFNTDIAKLDDSDKYPLICGMADITDAILSYRPYKKPLPKETIFQDFDNKGIINYSDKIGMVLGNN